MTLLFIRRSIVCVVVGEVDGGGATPGASVAICPNAAANPRGNETAKNNIVTNRITAHSCARDNYV
jgi:hypothetical protein